MPALPWVTIAAVASTAAAGVSTYKALTAKTPEMPKPEIVKEEEIPEVDTDEAEKLAARRQRLMAMSAGRGLSTLKTSPRGLLGGAPTERKTLLGS